MDFQKLEHLMQDLPADARAAARSAAVHAIQSGEKPDASMIPECLREIFCRLVNEAIYQRRNAGKRFDASRNYMPTQGTTRDANPILINVRL